ncbi:hypothetical protein LOK49_LG01G02895 [Camellia lanceoleosa]|uniref:Uncharacterized protein n=1 Tax=Camellia lanceoleosa TaxID=1840588 RepID=A0ACC0IVA8_9ERIC|nr:hypothetical protein LOK49_LG01G02895 [Camellia lanceoleosa]
MVNLLKSIGPWLWRHDENLQEASSVSSQAIHATIHKEDYKEWIHAAVYVSPNLALKESLWDDLEEVAENMDKPWLVAGDFNDYAN